MPVYKDEDRKTWYVSFYYTDWTGVKKRKLKRGFKRERDAKEFEREFLYKYSSNPEMTFQSLYDLYIADQENRIRVGTQNKKINIFQTHILPYFKDKKISEITPGDIRNWQNTMLNLINNRTGKPYSETYLRIINSELTAILNYAVAYHGLQINPASKVKPMGKKNADEMSFWTLEQFNEVIQYEKKPSFHLCFMILYWCGLRVGEALALTPKKILHDSKSLDIYETFHRINGEDMFGPPKTKNGVRKTPMPDFVYDELIKYTESLYGLGENDRIFYFTRNALNQELNYISKAAEMERIRVHDLRHSHVALLIKLGYRTHAIADRIGDTPEMVDRVYAHLYPDTSEQIARELDKYKDGFLVSQDNDSNTPNTADTDL
ncbi:MAG: site-specific integrase [Eubacterium sp.]|nr:site-specific integrase [Eubacterium sp.]